MTDSVARKYQGNSPRINNSDYDNGRESRRGDKLWRESTGGKKKIFPLDDKNAPTWWGCPRWSCLLIFFILFGALSGVTTWLIVKN